MTPPRIHRAARAEIVAALAQYDAIDPALAVDLQQRIEAAYLRIGMHPLQFPPHMRGTRQCLLRRFPFSIVFTVEPELVGSRSPISDADRATGRPARRSRWGSS